MHEDSRRFVSAASALPASAASGPAFMSEATAYALSAIGYEAADPSLQSAQWLEAMQVVPNGWHSS